MRRALAFSLSVAVLVACGGENQSGEQAGEQGTEQGNEDAGEPLGICGLMTSDRVAPSTLSVLPAAWDGANPAYLEVVGSADAIFTIGIEDEQVPVHDLFIERRNLDGGLVWSVRFDSWERLGRAAWDGEHLYVRFQRSVRRWQGSDGVEEAFSLSTTGSFRALGVSDTAVAVVDVVENFGFPVDPEWAVLTVTKDRSAASLTNRRYGGEYGADEHDGIAEHLVETNWGWIAVGVDVGEPASTIWMDGTMSYPGPDRILVDNSLDFAGRPAVAGVAPVADDGLLILGDVFDSATHQSRAWVSRVQGGRPFEEVSRADLDVCDGASTTLEAVANAGDLVWAWATVVTDSALEVPTNLLIELDLTGEVRSVRSMQLGALEIDGFTATDAGVVITSKRRDSQGRAELILATFGRE